MLSFAPRVAGDNRLLLIYTQGSEPDQIARVIIAYPDGVEITIDPIEAPVY